MAEQWYENMNNFEDDILPNIPSDLKTKNKFIGLDHFLFDELSDINQVIYSDTQEYLVQSRIVEDARRLKELQQRER